MSVAHALATPAGRARDDARSGRITLAILLLFAASQVLSGVLRWALGSVGLAALVYLPALLLWLEVARIALGRIVSGRLSMSALWLCLALVLAMLVGLLSLPAKQVVFGTWILAPVLFGHAATGGLDLSSRGSWQATLSTGAVLELGRGSSDEVKARTERFLRSVRQVAAQYGRSVDSVESADLRHADAYALRLRGVTVAAEGAPAPKKK